MVKVGFICEGFTEFILLQSQSFQNLLVQLNLESVNIINAEGAGNLLPHNISGYIESLEKEGAHVIIILTDLDDDVCVTQTKNRILARAQDVVIISIKKIEAWFLACHTAMRELLNFPNYDFPFPEQEVIPFLTINNLLVQYTGRGIGRQNSGKIKLIKRLLEKGLDIVEAANHENCSSAKYFLEKLKQIGTNKKIN